MDFSLVLILPFAAIVAFATAIAAVMLARPRPQQIWPFAFSTAIAAMVFIRLPDPSEIFIWIIMLFVIAVWAAFGTVIGTYAARILDRLLRKLK
jgi:ribose/xylose/arabinose/galactoside ABC-type transport system permease subunit